MSGTQPAKPVSTMCPEVMLPAAFTLAQFTDVKTFVERLTSIRLRNYQVQVARQVASSVLKGWGDSFVVLFPRQSGKNELQAHIEAYLLACHAQCGGELVKISPTWKPQTENSIRRLERVLKDNIAMRLIVTHESGQVIRVGNARMYFLSGSPTTHIVGATASTLLEVDEAQAINIPKFDNEIAPMAASTNATRVFWGTAWTTRTLLARELRASREQQLADGRQRVFMLTADEVAAEVPAYGRFVANQVARLGRNHPGVRTQYFSEELDENSGMFPLGRQALMRGSRPFVQGPQAGEMYALLVDVAGEETGTADGLANPGRDATALTVVQVDLSTVHDCLLRAPTYRVVARHLWQGENHTRLYGAIQALAETWRAQYVVVDATGLGAGLASFLERALPGKVLPFIFSSVSKSRLGWQFLGIIDSGRWQEGLYSSQGSAEERRNLDLQARFFRELSACEQQFTIAAREQMHWSVPAGARDAVSGELLHDDLVISAALCGVLEAQVWGAVGESLLIPGHDPLFDLDQGF